MAKLNEGIITIFCITLVFLLSCCAHEINRVVGIYMIGCKHLGLILHLQIHAYELDEQNNLNLLTDPVNCSDRDQWMANLPC